MKKIMLALLSGFIFCASHGMHQEENHVNIKVRIGTDSILVPTKQDTTIGDVKKQLLDLGMLQEGQQLYPLRAAFLRHLKVRDVADDVNVHAVMEEHCTHKFVIE